MTLRIAIISQRFESYDASDSREYAKNPLYLLLEKSRLSQNLSYQQLEDFLLKEGKEAGLDSKRIAQIVRGEILPNDRELLWIGAFIRTPDGRLYDHEELIELRDGTSSEYFETSEDDRISKAQEEGLNENFHFINQKG